MTRALDVVGLKEVAQRLGVEERTASMWKWRGLLPPADGIVSGLPVWRWSTIRKWATATGRLPKQEETA